jgi:hypothetical protein
MGTCIVSIFQYISNKMQRYTVYSYLETALHVSGGTSTHHRERIQLYLQHLVFVTRYCYLQLSWNSWNRFQWALGGVHNPQHTENGSNSSTIAADNSKVWQIPDAVDTVVCALDDLWKYRPKHLEQFPDINKLCNFASCWMYEYIEILLGAHPILHISRIRVKRCP